MIKIFIVLVLLSDVYSQCYSDENDCNFNETVGFYFIGFISFYFMLIILISSLICLYLLIICILRNKNNENY